MTASADMRALYLGEGTDATFAMFHPASGVRSAGVVMCPPFGWEAIAAHRGLRDWALALAAAGHPVLRIDLPGTGDAGGSPRDPSRVDAWTRSVARAACWLRAEADCSRVAAIGLGVGGLAAALAAAQEEGVDDLALWAVPGRGRTLVREMKAFARLNADQSAALAAEATPPQDGSLETGGFVLTSETLDALAGVDLTTLTVPRAAERRVLLLARDGIAPDEKLHRHLEHMGATVEVAPGDGYATLTSTPQQSRTPAVAIAATVDWLAGVPPGDRAPPCRQTPRAADHVDLDIDGVAIRERPFVIEEPGGRLHGVLAEPVGDARQELRALLLNAGAVRRVGPGRLWVEMARSWAAAGVSTLRLDMAAIGDSDGERDYSDDAALYVPEMVDQSLTALEAWDSSGESAGQPRYLIAGLCSGAYWGFHVALRDPRARSLIMLNPRALYWHQALEVTRDARKMMRVGRGSYWKRMLTGRVSARRVLSVLGWAVRAPVEVPRVARERRRGRREIEAGFDQLRDEGKRVLLVFGEDEPLDEELRAEGLLARSDRWPEITVERLTGRDHTLRPIPTQQRLHALMDRALAREMEATGQPGEGPAPSRLRAT